MIPRGRPRLPPGALWSYDFARRNLLYAPEGPLVASAARSGTPAIADAQGSDGFSDWIVIPGAPTTAQYYYLAYPGLTAGTWNFSTFVRMDDGTAPKPGFQGDATADFTLVMNGSAGNNIASGVQDYGGGLYRVWGVFSLSAASLTSNNGIVRYLGQNTKGFRVTGYQLTLGAALLPYEYPGAGQMATDRSVSGRNILPSADLTDPAYIKVGCTVTAYGTHPNGSPTYKIAYQDAQSQSPYITMPAATDTVAIASKRTMRFLIRRINGTANVTYRTGIGTSPANITSTVTDQWQEFYITQTGGAGNTSRQFILARQGNTGVDEYEVCEAMLYEGDYTPTYERPRQGMTMGTTTSGTYVDAADPVFVSQGLGFTPSANTFLTLPSQRGTTGRDTFAFTVPGPGNAPAQVSTIYNQNPQALTKGYIWIYRNAAGALILQWTDGTAYRTSPSILGFNTGDVGAFVIDWVALTWRCFCNGALVANGNLSGATMPLEAGVGYVGRYQATGTNLAAGVLSELTRWPRALSDSEIVQHYRYARASAGRRGALNFDLPGGPYAVWDMLDGSGQLARDSSGLARHLTLGATSSAETTDPTWAGGGLTFDGVDDAATHALTLSWAAGTVMIAGKYTFVSGSSSRVLAIGSGTVNNRLTLWNSGDGNLSWEYTNNAGTTTTIGLTVPSGTPFLVFLRWTAAGISGQVGTAAVLSNAVTFDAFTPTYLNLGNSVQAIGLNRPLTGTLYYTAVYGRSLTDLELSVAHRAIRGKLAARSITIPA